MAIKIYGTRCQACGFDFDEFHRREHAGSYIEVHHVKPLSEHEGEVDPANDLVCLCANCHRMVHRRMTSVTSVDELRVMSVEVALGGASSCTMHENWKQKNGLGTVPDQLGAKIRCSLG